MFDFLKKKEAAGDVNRNKSDHPIFLQNTYTNKEEEFKPVKDGEVSMYHCGPTVYSKAHIGNMRAYVFADLLGRLFRFNGYKTHQVINITDVGHLVSDNDDGEDKVEKKAKETGRTAKEITEEYTRLYMEDIQKLNIDSQNFTFPKATDYIKEQIELIQTLEKKGVTYQTSDGIYYDTSKFSEYGVLGNVNVEQQKAGARIEENEEKRNKTDFALWKFSPKDQKRQQEWNSPWGVGFPGWHLECSVMSEKILGKKFDIHTGGIEHIQIHHNNEIAQSQMAHGEVQANYWLHHNHILVNNQKMSKSDGTVFFLSDLEERKIDSIVYRYWLLTAHYSTLSNFTWDALEAAESAYKKLVGAFKGVKAGKGKINDKYLEEATTHLNNNLDTPQAIAVIWKMLKDEEISKEDAYATTLEIDRVLGLKIAENSQKSDDLDIPKEILEKAEKRQEMRKSGDFEGADKLRDELKEAGFEVLDKGDGFEVRSNKI